MSNKILWSNNMTKDHITSLTEDEKFNALVDRGYDKDALELSDLNKILEDDDFMGHDDLEKIEDELVPMINKQARDGIIFIDGKAIFADELPYIEGDLVIEEDEDGLLINGKPVYAIPEELDKLDAFIYGAMPAAWEFETEDGTDEDMAIATLEDEVRDPNFINDFIDEEKIAEFCPRVKMIIEEAVEAPIEEEMVDEAKTDDKKGLAKELKEIKALADEYGFKYFTSMPFSDFDDDPITIEYQYPNFARVVKAFFKEMGVLTAEEVKDPDEMDVQWDEGINQHDWDTIIKTCEMLKDHNSVQIEKVYKNGYATLDDDEILADRKRQDDLMAELEGDINDEYDESLNEGLRGKFRINDADDLVDLNERSDGEVFDDLCTTMLDMNYNQFEIANKLCKNIDRTGWGYTPANMALSTKDSAEEWRKNGPYDDYDMSEKEVKKVSNSMAMAANKIYKYNLKLANRLLKGIKLPTSLTIPSDGSRARLAGGRTIYDLDNDYDESLDEAKDQYSRVEDWADDNADLITEEDVIASIREAGCPEEVEIKVLDLVGPAGGWPVVEFIGPEEVVDAFLEKCGFEKVEESLDEAKEKSLKEIVREIKVNGPAFRGDEYPAFDELAINEKNFDDGLRFKEYDIDVDEDDNVVINWTSQEFGDWESLEEEIIRCLKANMAKYGIPSLKLIFKGDSRDGGHEFEDEFELSNIEEGLVKEDTATDVELDEFPWGPLNK